jgi:hypothetical protein
MLLAIPRINITHLFSKRKLPARWKKESKNDFLRNSHFVIFISDIFSGNGLRLSQLPIKLFGCIEF